MTLKTAYGTVMVGAKIDYGPCCGDVGCVGSVALTAGTGEKQADRFFSSPEILIGPGLTETIDLAALEDPESGAIISMATVRMLFVKNRNTHAADILAISADTFDAPWGGAPGTNHIGPGDSMYLAETTTGYLAGGGTFDLTNLSPDRTMKVSLCIVGTSV